MNKLIDIAFSGFWQFCGVIVLFSVLQALLAELIRSILEPIFKKKPYENQP